MLTLLVSVIALCVAGWALWCAVVALVTARATQRTLATVLQHAVAQEAAKETALRLLDELTVKSTEEVKAATARIQALRAQIREHQDSLATWTPPSSKRVQ